VLGLYVLLRGQLPLTPTPAESGGYKSSKLAGSGVIWRGTLSQTPAIPAKAESRL
jgi:hypothetical protein